MKAIVLTFDLQTGVAELVYKKYMEIWPDCPLTFLIPYHLETNPCLPYFRKQKNILPVKTQPDIPATMTALLQDCKDDEWVFWCTDDRYPSQGDAEKLHRLYQYLCHEDTTPWEAIKLFKWKEEIHENTVQVAGLDFHPQSCKTAWGFYHHHFLRAGILRRFFLEPPKKEDSKGIRDIHAHNVETYHNHLNYPTEGYIIPATNIIHSFWEPLREGKLTLVFRNLLEEYHCHQIPNYELIDVFKKYQ